MKRLLTCLLLLLAVSVQADMSPRLDSMITWLECLGNMPAGGTDGVSKFDEYKLVNMACQDISSMFPAIEKYDTVRVDSAETVDTLNTDFVGLKAVYYLASDTLRIPVEIVSFDSLAAEYSDKSSVDNSTEKSDPTDNRKCWVHKKRLKFHPRWARGDTATYQVEYYAIDSMLHASASQTQILPQYRMKIIFRAVGYLCMMRGDFEKAEKWFGRSE